LRSIKRTGKLQWKTEIAPELGPQRKYLSNALVYYGGIIYTGLSGGDSGVRGLITALDAQTGAEVWHFDTVPGPGEFGHETWEGDSWKYGGAAGWMHPAIDPDLGLLYTPTGNSWPDNGGLLAVGLFMIGLGLLTFGCVQAFPSASKRAHTVDFGRRSCVV
jgi:glucose dehydrogenase